MTLEHLMEIVSDAYPDGLVMSHYQGEDRGDTLAKFIASELEETFEPDDTDLEQAKNALRKMETAKREIECVIDAIQGLIDGINESERVKGN